MATCKLCLGAEATKTNSHIFPHSLIKETVNIGGSKNRDKEFMFNFSNTSSPSHYQGQSVIPEAIENLKSEINNIAKEEHNPTTEDFIFCPCCESRFSEIEGYFAEKIIAPFSKSNMFNNQDRTTFSLKNSDNRLLRLYVYGLFWRASISRIYDFKLSAIEEKKLREWINYGMDCKIEVAQSKVEILPGFCDLPLSIFIMEKFDDTTRSFINANVFSNKPYMNLIGDFVFFLYFKKKDTKGLINNFYGLAKYLSIPGLVNSDEEKVIFGKIFKNEREIILKNALDFLTLDNISVARRRFSQIHKAVFGIRPRPQDLLTYMQDYAARGANVSDSMQIDLIQTNLISIAKAKVR